jgi:hypothetical protein
VGYTGWRLTALEFAIIKRYFQSVSTAEKIFQKAQSLPKQAQAKLLCMAEKLEHECETENSNSLTLRESAELRGKLAAWEEDWSAPGMEAYDRP